MTKTGFDFAGRNCRGASAGMAGDRETDGRAAEDKAEDAAGRRCAVAFYMPVGLARDFKVCLARSSTPGGRRLTATDVLDALVSAWVAGEISLNGTWDSKPHGQKTRVTAYFDEALARNLWNACAEAGFSASAAGRMLVARWLADTSIVEIPSSHARTA
ncbi:MAG: hypothetical protein MR874_11195 [Coriobacteriaceae bacterium]|nr:hypothetical protein [Coriobacteriaceae bacterium]